MASAEAFDRAHLWRFRAKPLRVIDGDTLVVLCDTGFRGRHEAHVRLGGHSAPEMREPGGEDARRALDAAVFDRGGVELDWPLRVVTAQRETVVSEVRSFERYVGDVYVVSRGDRLVNVVDVMAGA